MLESPWFEKSRHRRDTRSIRRFIHGKDGRFSGREPDPYIDRRR